MSRSHAGLVTVVMLLMVGPFGCGPAVSDHDNRIFAASASVKLSAADLSTAYASDRGAADGRYRARVLEVSGVVHEVHPGGPMLMLKGGDSGPQVEASLHEEVAVEMLKTVAEGQRITLKCFCQGLDHHVRLKSCVPPDTGR